MDTLKLVEKLTSAVGVSGAEDNIVKLLCDILKDYGDVSVDSLNNVYCTFGGGYHFLLDAHLDEIGFIVKAITDDGFIKVDKCGGIDNRMLPASEVSVWGDKEYRGVISALPPHLQKSGDEKKSPDLNDISIDIGMTEEQAQKHISLGDKVTFKRNFTPLIGSQVSSSALDDRAGVAAIILALDKLKNIDTKITVMFSSQEEVGTRGAKVGPYDKQIDEAVAVDVSFGYTPLCKKSDCGEIGKGGMIGISPVLDRRMSKALIETAEEYNIPYQNEVMGGSHTGTNADVISICEYGIRTALISVPLKYMHSPIEIADINDIEAVADLIAAYIRKRVGEIYA